MPEAVPHVAFKRVGSIFPTKPRFWAAASAGIILFSLKARLYFLDRMQQEREVYLREQGLFYIIEHDNKIKADKFGRPIDNLSREPGIHLKQYQEQS